MNGQDRAIDAAFGTLYLVISAVALGWLLTLPSSGLFSVCAGFCVGVTALRGAKGVARAARRTS